MSQIVIWIRFFKSSHCGKGDSLFVVPQTRAAAVSHLWGAIYILAKAAVEAVHSVRNSFRLF